MGRKKYAQLERIDNDRKITYQTDSDFLFMLQNGLLLALKEEHILTQMQYRNAAEALKQQHRTYLLQQKEDRS